MSRAAARRPSIPQAWLALASLALALSALCAVLLVAAKVPALASWLPGRDLFGVALTLHVNLAVHVWLMGSIAWVVGIDDGAPDPTGALALGLACAGLILALFAALTHDAPAALINYVPLLDSHAFIAGLALFAGGFALHATAMLRRGSATNVPGARLGLGGVLVALIVFVADWLRWHPELGLEALFWGVGHALQLGYALWMVLLWNALATPAPSALPRWILAALAAPLAGVLILTALFAPDDPLQHAWHTELMRYAGTLMLLAGVATVTRSRAQVTLRVQWRCSPVPMALLLAGTGALAGTAIDGDTLWVPAHYHGMIGAITLTFMAFIRRAMVRSGAGKAYTQLARWLLPVYGWGLLAMIGGLAWMGMAGIGRKLVHGPELDATLLAWGAVGLTGVGGIVAVSAACGFAVATLGALWYRGKPERSANDLTEGCRAWINEEWR